jgi:mRNA-degrading endonuclease RelE of RelBE toxin-antitoxin system
MRKTAHRYFENLDKPTQQRMREKLNAIASDPTDVKHSKPLLGCDRRSARVGRYRILFLVSDCELFVTDIKPRGDVYKGI